MTLPDQLNHTLTDELAGLSDPGGVRPDFYRTLPVPAVAPEPAPEAPAAAAEPPAKRRLRVPTVAGIKFRLRKKAVHGVRAAVHRLAADDAGRELVEPFVAERTDPLVGRVASLTEQVAALSAQLAVITADQGQSVTDRINMALMKNDVIAISGRVNEVLGEMRQQEQRLIDLGMAFAPGAGLIGAASRFAELREQINSVERRLRHAPAAAAIEGNAPVLQGSADVAGVESASTPAISSATAGSAAEPARSVTSELFNYVGFERRFRGDPEAILQMQTERYGALLAQHAPVVDVGCGRAELLENLQHQGIACIGVDTDSGMVAEGRARGLDIRHTDVLNFLRQAPAHSIGSVFSAHLAEHLDLDVLISFLELSVAKLRPGGIFIAETPNPASLIVLGNSYILDPTHVRPLHPSLLAFLCETAGFRDVRLEFYSPATSYQLARVDDADAPDWIKTINANSDRLNDVLFGPQEYAVVATTPS